MKESFISWTFCNLLKIYNTRTRCSDKMLFEGFLCDMSKSLMSSLHQRNQSAYIICTTNHLVEIQRSASKTNFNQYGTHTHTNYLQKLFLFRLSSEGCPVPFVLAIQQNVDKTQLKYIYMMNLCSDETAYFVFKLNWMLRRKYSILWLFYF